eukprot:scaffold73662_cov21-Tisochrysis_lutea.AAC.1
MSAYDCTGSVKAQCNENICLKEMHRMRFPTQSPTKVTHHGMAPRHRCNTEHDGMDCATNVMQCHGMALHHREHYGMAPGHNVAMQQKLRSLLSMQLTASLAVPHAVCLFVPRARGLPRVAPPGGCGHGAASET